jgi:hypothetical protein
VARALLAACCVFLAAGCGSNDSTARDSILTFGGGGGTSSVFVLGTRSQRVPVRQIYSVFRRAQRTTEASLAAQDVACGTGSDEEEEGPGMGEPQAKTARILLRDIGNRGYELVALATTHDAVSLSLVPDGSGICGQPTADGLAFAAELEKRDAIVFGLVGDGVTAVDLVIDGVSQRAKLGENGFALEIPNAAGKTLDKIVLHDAHGSTTEFPAR